MMMDSYETTRALFSRIQAMDPENASKIMGYILIQDQGENEILRLAFGPDSHLVSLISTAKSHLGISLNTSSAQLQQPASAATSVASSYATLSPPISISRPSPLSLPLSSPRHLPYASSPSPPSPWPPHSPSHSLSYAAVVNGTANPQLPFKIADNNSSGSCFSEEHPTQEHNLSFLDNPVHENVDFFDHLNADLATISPSCRSDSVAFPYWESGGSNGGVDCGANGLHRRSCSVNDVCLGTEDSTSGFGFKPCLYYQRGFCKNGSACKFVHGGGFGDQSGENSPSAVVGSPCGKFDAAVFEQCHQQEVMRAKVASAAQQQRIAAAQFMAAGANFPYNKLGFLQNEAQRSAAAASAEALMMGEELHKMNRCRVGRSEFAAMGGGCGDANPGSRQIYLTFPADSTFREEDVSNYFSLYGPVQDVRIPYQQKRMFGFVTFMYPETVKLILAKGNPHFVCDSRVLVKPYKEKGKLPDKKQQQQQFERSEFSSCSSPTGLDCREPFDIQLGSRVMYNNTTQEMLWRRKLEHQADLQQALELQGRRLMNLQLMDLKSHYQPLHSISVGSPIKSPHHGSSLHHCNGFDLDISQENKGGSAATPEGQLTEDVNAAAAAAIDDNGKANGNGREEDDPNNNDERDLSESLEHILPDNLFSSPTKAVGEHRSIFSPSPSEMDGARIMTSSSNSNGDSLMPIGSSLNKTPLKSCFLEMPRFSSGHGAIGM
ncbi:hypothetical protein Droror1_Dr00025623 [Drosera rotundifolia]